MNDKLFERLRDSTYIQFPRMAAESADRIEQLEAENAAFRRPGMLCGNGAHFKLGPAFKAIKFKPTQSELYQTSH
jgi:hypothetical protein